MNLKSNLTEFDLNLNFRLNDFDRVKSNGLNSGNTGTETAAFEFKIIEKGNIDIKIRGKTSTQMSTLQEPTNQSQSHINKIFELISIPRQSHSQHIPHLHPIHFYNKQNKAERFPSS